MNILSNKKIFVLFILSGLFVTNAIIAEMISSKLGQFGPFTAIVGLIPWPIVFLTTDIVNEYYGKEIVKKLSYLTVGLIAYSFIVLYIAMQITTSPNSPATDAQFKAVFGQTNWVIVGSITAFFISQLVDVSVFWFIRRLTGEKLIWLRTTGSTIVSQFVDSFVVLAIGFLLPGKISFDQFIEWGFTGYLFKLIIAVALTPIIYIVHSLMDKLLGKKEKNKLAKEEINS